MRKNFTISMFIITSIMVIITFISCAKEFLPEFSSQIPNEVNEAKAIFEATATDLREIDFGLTAGQETTKSNNKSVIIPQWSRPFIVKNDRYTIYELPLGGDLN